jgi:Na+/melibiose symporter-like transporter
MLPDVIDNYMLETSEQNEEIFYSIFVFFGKISTGIGTSLTSLALE